MARLPFARRPRLSLAIALVAGFAVALALRVLVPPEDRVLTLTPVVQEALSDPDSPWTGAARPEVTVVVFTDYLCPVCKRTDPALIRLLADDPGVRVVWKLWPIRGEASQLAAASALAADRQGRFLPVHEALMAARGELTSDRIDSIAAAAGADPARLAADRAAHGPAIADQLGRHRLQAFGLGLRGTPSYLVGPYLIEGGLDDRRLRRAVSRARRAGPPSTP